LLFAGAVIVIGLLGPGALWEWGYQYTLPFVVCLPVLWVIEFGLYSLVSRKGALGILPGLGLGLLGRGVMAAAAATWAAGAAGFIGAFVRYYAEFWLGGVLQIVMATMLLWLLADLVPAVQELADAEGGAPRRRNRRRLLDELLASEGRAARGAAVSEEEDEEEPEEEAEAAEEAAPEPEVAAPEEPTLETGPVEEPTAPVVQTPVSYGPADEIMQMAVLEAARHASGVEELQALTGPSLDFGDRPVPQVIGNPPREADALAVSSSCLRVAASVSVLSDAAMLGQPTVAALLPKAGGILLVPAQGALVCVRSPVSQPVGALVAQGRKLATALQAPWPAGLDQETGAVSEAPPACEGLVAQVAQTGHTLRWHDLGSLGVVALVASAGADHVRAAAAAEALWRAAADLSRQCNHSTLRRLLICGERGAAAAAPVRIGDGGFLLARLAPGAQPGLVMAELESLAAACQAESQRATQQTTLQDSPDDEADEPLGELQQPLTPP
jgi:predicted regulator of Ras-like GTPase activity (Roadblock/LC7/MglB family)